MPFSDLRTQEIYHIFTDLVVLPMAFTKADGKFLWANQAFCDIVDYNLMELLGEDGVSWKELTVDPNDLQDDEEALKQITDGVMDRYTLVKKYKTKTGRLVPIRLVVQRFPKVDDIQFFVVSATRLDNGYKDAFDYANQFIKKTVNDIFDKQAELSKEIQALHKEQTVLQQNVIDTMWISKIAMDAYSSLKANPKLVLAIIVVLGCIFYGDATLSILTRIKQAFLILWEPTSAQATVLPSG